MKRDGQPLRARARALAVIPRADGDLTFQIQAIPLGFGDALDRELPAPRPQVRTVHAKGRSETEVLRDDPAHIAAVAQNNDRRGALVIREALRADPSVSFESDALASADVKADGILREMSDAGLSAGDIRILADQIDALSNLTPEAVREATKRFTELRQGAAQGQQN